MYENTEDVERLKTSALVLTVIFSQGQQRIYGISYSILRTDSTPRRLKLSCLTQPLPACSVGSYIDRQVVHCAVYC